MEENLWIYTHGQSDLTIKAIPEENKDWLAFDIEVRNEYIELKIRISAMKSELCELINIIDKYVKDENSYANKNFNLTENGLEFQFLDNGCASLKIEFVNSSDNYSLYLDTNDLKKISDYLKEQLEKYK